MCRAFKTVVSVLRPNFYFEGSPVFVAFFKFQYHLVVNQRVFGDKWPFSINTTGKCSNVIKALTRRFLVHHPICD